MIKNILWIDDMDTKDSAPDYEKTIAKYFGNYNDNVKLIIKFYKESFDKEEDPYICADLLGYIDEHMTDIDCVVLDMNMKMGMPMMQDKYKDLFDHFNSGGVILKKPENLGDSVQKTDGNVYFDDKYFMDNAGFYIYLYLLHKGFPYDRIFMNTAYADDERYFEKNENESEDNKEETNWKKWKDAFEKAGVKFPPYVSKDDGKKPLCEEKIDKLKLYSGENEYYLVRRIVFSAIEYYKNKLNNNKITLDPFNGNMKTELTNFEMYDIFDNIKLNFPQRLPQNCGSIYITALKLISGPFESKRNRNKKSDELYTYQRVTKILRNWLAHNKFDSEINKNEFLILFIVALRSYFGTDPIDDDNEFENFETSAFELIKCNNKNLNTVDSYIRSYFLLSDVCRKEKTLSLDYIEYLDKVKGWDNKSKCEYSDFLKGLLIWKYNFSIESIQGTPGSDSDMLAHIKSNEENASQFCNKLMTAIEAEVFSEEATIANPGELLHL